MPWSTDRQKATDHDTTTIDYPNGFTYCRMSNVIGGKLLSYVYVTALSSTSIVSQFREKNNVIDIFHIHPYRSSTMSEAASREILTRQLAALLGFDDGADAVLEHLLTIESGEVSAEIVFVCRPAPRPFRH